MLEKLIGWSLKNRGAVVFLSLLVGVIGYWSFRELTIALSSQLIDDHYPADEWNIYPFHFSDGDNWSMDDTLACVDLLKTQLLPKVNMFAYGQVESPYGSGQFIKDLKEHFSKDERVVTSEIRDKDAVVGSIKDFLGKGK